MTRTNCNICVLQENANMFGPKIRSCGSESFLSNISETHVTQQLSFESQANLIFLKISSLLKQSDPYIEWWGVSGTD